MALTERSSTGFLTGGVSDTVPDWLGSYDEGYTAAQTQKESTLRQQEAKQRMAESAAVAQREAARFANEQADREAALKAAQLGLQMPSDIPFDAIQGPGLMPEYQVPVAPEPRAPSEKYADELAPRGTGAISRDQFIQLLPEFARMEQAEGLPNNYLETISMLESSGGVNTGTGQYTGIFQIGPEVAKDFGVTPEQLKDPRINAQVAAKLASRNAKYLRRMLDREPQAWELYLAHQQGAGGAAFLLRFPNAKAVAALTEAYGGDRARAEQAVVQNGGDPNMTAGQFAALWAQKFGGALPQPFTGAPGGAAKEVPALPGLQSQATRTGRMPSEIARLTPAATPVAATEQTVAGGKGSVPAGVLDVQQPAPGVQVPPAQAAPGVQAPPPAAPPPTDLGLPNVAATDLIPRTSAADYAGLNDGTGSLATAIARTRPGEVPKTPDLGMYLFEPAMITNDRRLLAMQQDEIQRQLQIASLTRDFTSMATLRNQAVQNQLASNLLGAMEVIATMQQGDNETFARTLSGLTQGRQRLQPRSDGSFNIYYDNELVGEGVSRNQIIATLRMQYDKRYQELAAAQAKASAERETKMLESDLKVNEAVLTEEAKALRERATKAAEAQLRADPRYREYSVTTVSMPDGSTALSMTPKAGQGTPVIYQLEPDYDINGQPVVDANNAPKLVWKQKSISGTSAVPVQ